MEILIGITRELEAEGLLRHPVVGLEPALGPELCGRLGEVVRKMGGSVAAAPGEWEWVWWGVGGMGDGGWGERGCNGEGEGVREGCGVEGGVSGCGV